MVFYRECGTCNERWVIGMTSTCKCPDKKPKREWVGLTDEEAREIRLKVGSAADVYAKAIEVALKEKNT